jgi:hypothetical protein
VFASNVPAPKSPTVVSTKLVEGTVVGVLVAVGGTGVAVGVVVNVGEGPGVFVDVGADVFVGVGGVPL